MIELSQFHFIYPLWLLALIPSLTLYFLLQRQQEATSQWRNLISANLLPYLIDKKGEKERVRPYRLLLAGFILATLALAGPTWQREPSPFAEDEAPLAIALDLSPSMTVTDIQPSRLERGKQKIRDLLALRSTGSTALVAYSGSGHLVMPLTEDSRIIETYLTVLSPNLMPIPGNAPNQALKVADTALSKTTVPGSILFITDGIGVDQTQAFIEYSQQSENDIVVLGIGTLEGGNIADANNTTSTYSRLDRQGLEKLSRQAGVYVTYVSLDNSDVEQIYQHIQKHLTDIEKSDSDRWRNEGYWLVYPLAGLLLLWFRRGWTIQWLAVFLVGFLLWESPVLADPYGNQGIYLAEQPSSFVNLWLTRDQQGRWLFERGNYADAAERFDNPFWKGIAYYINKDFEQATQQFSEIKPKTPEIYFNLGNAYAQQEDYKNALKNYDRALGMRSDYADAQNNRDLVQKLLEKEEELAKQRPEEQSGDLKADKIVEDDTPPSDDDQDNDHPRPNLDGIGNTAIADLWLQNVQTTPADFLKQKFQYQLETKDQ
ncbi:vWA domain-containing protein [Crocosphaera chwakensis]|uniref:Tetratricopeptide TPR_4 n=1 Tax=Crocosphaera chwakensis CCY0110 TaxID=391612 RepID=A3IME1_9CHRO|nr:VWA domain-containing protein [Crocosphaera chwakensis]EAZ92310.1 Tetratricopeptide TPR_4 [Crocosphaera chwakensis CCY0110]